MIYLTNPQTWIVVLTTLIVVSGCIVIHFEILNRCSQYLKLLSHSRRRRVLILIFIILIAHTIEIWLFSAGYFLMVDVLRAGDLAGVSVENFPDYVYYSTMVFTTVGFGDILPSGPIRFMSGMEALTGLVMITWSASYTFLEMQRDWPSDRH